MEAGEARPVVAGLKPSRGSRTGTTTAPSTWLTSLPAGMTRYDARRNIHIRAQRRLGRAPHFSQVPYVRGSYVRHGSACL